MALACAHEENSFRCSVVDSILFDIEDDEHCLLKDLKVAHNIEVLNQLEDVSLPASHSVQSFEDRPTAQ